jgi:hypothetical protein
MTPGKRMRVIVRRHRPHPGAQLHLTDIDGHRFTCSPPTQVRAAGGPGAAPSPRLLRGQDQQRQKAPGCVTSRCTALTRTRSGPSSSRWPANCLARM